MLGMDSKEFDRLVSVKISKIMMGVKCLFWKVFQL